METVFLWTLVDLLEGSEFAIFVAIGFAGYFISTEVKSEQGTKWSVIMVSIGCLFLVAKITQMTLLGPRFIRYYLTDIGFITGVAYMVFQTANRTRKLRSRGVRAVWFAVILAFSTEAFQLFAKSRINMADIVEKGPTNMGDWWDMMIFLVMTPITFWLMSKHTWTLANRIAEQQCKFKMNGPLRTTKIKQLLEEIY